MSEKLIYKITNYTKRNEDGSIRVTQMTEEEYKKIERRLLDAIYSSKSIDDIKECIDWEWTNSGVPYNLMIALYNRLIELDYNNPDVYDSFTGYLTAYGDPTMENENKILYLYNMNKLLGGKGGELPSNWR